jgi:hypothetical protein
MKNTITNFLLLVLLLTTLNTKAQQESNLYIPPFNMEIASKFVSMASGCIFTEYPNKISHTMQSDTDAATPKQLHPAFYGCYDWHSSVHGHWLLVKSLELFPNLPQRNQIIEILNKSLTAENIATECAYFKEEGRSSFERPYGWAWLLKLEAELATSNEAYAKPLFNNLKPLADQIKTLYYEYLPGLYYPIRRGVHENTAFGIALALDYARTVGDKEFEKFLIERAMFFYGNDRNIPASWEPDGEDFFSPSLIEADLMRRVLSKDEFVKWFKDFMPQLPFSLQYPAVVSDRNDPKGVHLDGLNLSRAWCMFELAKVVPDDSQIHRDLWQSGYRHAAEALPNVISDNYNGTHWLATFATYMYLSLSGVNQ